MRYFMDRLQIFMIPLALIAAIFVLSSSTEADINGKQ